MKRVINENWINRRKSLSVGLILVIIGNILLSFDALLVRIAGVSGWSTSFWFGIFTFMMMMFLSWKKHGNGLFSVVKEEKGPLTITSLLVCTSVVLFIMAVKYTSVANAAVIRSSAPVFSALFSWIILKEKTNMKIWLAILFTMIGIAVVVSGSFGNGNILGDILAFTSTAVSSLNFTLWRKYPEVEKEMSLGLGGLVLSLISLNFINPLDVGTSSFIALIIMGVVTAPFGRLAVASATRHMSAANVTLYNPVITILTSVWAWIFLEEQVGNDTIVGGVIIVSTLMVYTILSDETKRE